MTRTLAVNDHELCAILSGLKRVRNNILGLQRRDNEKGWKPAEGKQDVQALRLATVDKLLKRLDGGTP